MSGKRSKPGLKLSEIKMLANGDDELAGEPRVHDMLPKTGRTTEANTTLLHERAGGAIDAVINGKMHGWAWSGDPDDGPMSVVLMDGGKRILEFCADEFRPDLKDVGYGDGHCAFAVVLPARLFDEKNHDFRLLHADSDAYIPGASKTLQLTQKMALPRLRPVEGHVDGVRGIHVEGWAYDPENPDEPVSVEVFDGDRLLAVGVADHYRVDLEYTGSSHGYCAFRVSLPDEYLDGRGIDLNVCECSTGDYLAGSLPLQALDNPCIEAKLTELDGQVLAGVFELDTADAIIDLELWIDGIWADRFTVIRASDESRWSDFKHTVPERFMDGEDHLFDLALADTRLVIASARFTTPARIFLHEAMLVGPKRKAQMLPAAVRSFIARCTASSLFDRAYYSEKVNRPFADDEEAVLHYIGERSNWRHATSPWLDVPFIREISGEITRNAVSPLEWYFRQGIGQEVGPNPLFSNADYQILAGLASDAKPEGASFFDDWLAQAQKSPAVAPSVLVDLGHISSSVGEGTSYESGRVLEHLKTWLETPPEKRRVDTLHPCFDEDWLGQCFILNHNRPKGCLFTAFRLGRMEGQSPYPVLQQGRDTKNYYALIRGYEILYRATGIDDIAQVCPEIDADAFYAQYPVQPAGQGRSSLYRYASGSAAQPHKSFIRALDDDFVAAEYAGLVDYCLAARGVGDINRTWSRWLRLLGVPGNYIDGMGTRGDVLSIQNLAQLKEHKYRPEQGISASFIIPSYARDDLALRCVLSAVRSPGANTVEFILAEDAAHVDCAWILGYFLPFARIIKNPVNLGFLLSCNAAVKESRGAIFVLVNNDIIVHPNALNEMLGTFGDRPEAAVVGGLVLNVDGSIQENAGMLWKDATAWNYHRNRRLEDESVFNVREADYVSGCWIGIRRGVWDQIGGFDTRYVPAYCEESDFCMSAWQNGHKVYINPLSVVTHLDGATMGQDENSNTLKGYQKINRAKLLEKWKYQLGAMHNENGQPTPFHTGRYNNKRFISIVFDHYLPEPDRDAGSRTMYSICETLAAIENNYVLFVPANNHRSKYAAALERMGIEIITGAEGWKRFDHLLMHQREHVKYVFVSRLQVAKQYTWHLDQLHCPKSIYIHDIDTLRGFPHEPDSQGHQDLVEEAMSQYAEKNQAAFAKFNHIVSCSEDETRLLKAYFGDKVVDIFPYNHRAITAAELDGPRGDLIFVGSYNHTPNREAIQYFIENIWPGVIGALPDVRLHLCGSGLENAQSLSGRNIILHGHVTDQTLDYLYSISRLAIAPLLTGAGIKGKVIEASAHGVACVGSEVAWQGLDLPKDYAYLSGSIATFGERLMQAYRAYDADMAAGMLQFHEQCRARNNIADVIPRLIKPKGRK